MTHYAADIPTLERQTFVGIVNDPNKWLFGCGEERYIVDLILKVVTVSMKTQKVVASLPKLEF